MENIKDSKKEAYIKKRLKDIYYYGRYYKIEGYGYDKTLERNGYINKKDITDFFIDKVKQYWRFNDVVAEFFDSIDCKVVDDLELIKKKFMMHDVYLYNIKSIIVTKHTYRYNRRLPFKDTSETGKSFDKSLKKTLKELEKGFPNIKKEGK